jgi:hypothetical protein
LFCRPGRHLQAMHTVAKEHRACAVQAISMCFKPSACLACPTLCCS